MNSNVELKKALDKILVPFLKQFKGTVTDFSINGMCDNYYNPMIKLYIEDCQVQHFNFENYVSSMILAPIIKLGKSFTLHSFDCRKTYPETEFYVSIEIELNF